MAITIKQYEYRILCPLNKYFSKGNDNYIVFREAFTTEFPPYLEQFEILGVYINYINPDDLVFICEEGLITYQKDVFRSVLWNEIDQTMSLSKTVNPDLITLRLKDSSEMSIYISGKKLKIGSSQESYTYDSFEFVRFIRNTLRLTHSSDQSL